LTGANTNAERERQAEEGFLMGRPRKSSGSAPLSSGVAAPLARGLCPALRLVAPLRGQVPLAAPKQAG